MKNYDLVITASCYFSPHHSIRLIKSVPVIDGNVLTIITCPHRNEAEEIAAAVQDEKSNIVILHSERRERHLCQDLGFVWCLANGIEGKYCAFTDDDIEFTVSNILTYLESAPLFSVLGFSSNTTHYGVNPFLGTHQWGSYFFDPCWVDGHNLFTNWDTNLKAGLMDEIPGSFNSSFVEVEYAHRLSLITDRSTIGCRLIALNHHSRVDNVEKLRDAENKQSVIHCGYQLWQHKFGLALSAGDFNSGKIGWHDIENVLRQPHYAPLYQRHMIFDEHWLDYDKIWEIYRSGISIVYSNLE